MAVDMTGITEYALASGAKRYRAEAWDNSEGRRCYKGGFTTPTAAANWRRDAQVKIKMGTMHAHAPLRIDEAWDTWLGEARAGVIRSRGGSTYKPGVLRTYELSYDARVAPAFGRMKVGELRRVHVQRFVDKMVAEGCAAQTVRNTVTALRVLLKWCVRDEHIALNPCDGVELPSGGKARDRIETPSGALALVQALDSPADRALMATAFFAGLRRGELMGLRWKDVDLAGQTITVDAKLGNYDPRTQTFGTPKSKKGARTLGIPELLVPYLHRWPPIRHDDALVFGRAHPWVPFSDTALRDRCVPRWERAGLVPITLHEARHAYASVMIAAGVNIKTISEWMGHSSVNITLDRYGHLLPGSAAAALGLLNAYLTEELADV